jgi:ribosomal protein S18 acetylase RimI-like enzyme
VSELTIRAARPEEYDRAGELTVAAYRAAGAIADDDRYAPILRDAATRAEQAQLYVAVLPGDDGMDRVVATVTLAAHGSPWAEIAGPAELEVRMLAVAADCWGRGIGRALVAHTEHVARSGGYARIVLLVIDGNGAAQHLYEAAGYRRAPDRDWRPVPDLLLLSYVLDLTPSA